MRRYCRLRRQHGRAILRCGLSSVPHGQRRLSMWQQMLSVLAKVRSNAAMSQFERRTLERMRHSARETSRHALPLLTRHIHVRPVLVRLSPQMFSHLFQLQVATPSRKRQSKISNTIVHGQTPSHKCNELSFAFNLRHGSLVRFCV